MVFFKKFLLNLVNKSGKNNERNILDLLEKNENAALLDLGCDDGEWTVELGEQIGTNNIFGIDVVENRIREAAKRGIACRCADLNGCLPLDNSYYDVVHANQVIEHIHNLEGFIKEIYRVLKPDGYAIISTENLASWHNILSLVFGWQPFSATNYTLKNLGNPLSVWRGQKADVSKTWCHDKLWAYKGLIEFFESYNFKIEKIKGAGYYPLPSSLGNVDVRHCHWITFKIRKK